MRVELEIMTMFFTHPVSHTAKSNVDNNSNSESSPQIFPYLNFPFIYLSISMASVRYSLNTNSEKTKQKNLVNHNFQHCFGIEKIIRTMNNSILILFVFVLSVDSELKESFYCFPIIIFIPSF